MPQDLKVRGKQSNFGRAEQGREWNLVSCKQNYAGVERRNDKHMSSNFKTGPREVRVNIIGSIKVLVLHSCRFLLHLFYFNALS